jgi:ribosomal protein L18E
MQKLKFKLQSESPLILHNGQTADPLNRYSKMMKEVSSKRAKTDADFAELARIEWYASLYLDNNRVCVPGEVLEAAFVNGAKKSKLGTQAKAGLFVADNAILEFDGSNLTIDELWERDENRFTIGVRVQRNKIMRTRFRVNQWSAIVEVVYDPKQLNKSQVVDAVKATGEQVGICDWRPKFGRFAADLVG